MALRFLAEDPWERLAALREAVPNICLQMLLRGRNTVGYTPYPNGSRARSFPRRPRTGIDIFRIFDALNDVDQMRPAIDAVRETGTAVAEVALCYTGDLLDPNESLYTLDYYLDLAEQIVEAGAHVLAIKDMAGLLRAPAAHPGDRAARAVRPAGAPAHPRHPRRTAGHPVGGVEAGVDAVDVASAAMAGTTASPRCRPWSPPPTTPSTHRSRPRGGLRPRAVLGGPRRLYAPFESGLPARRAGLHPRDPGRAAVQPASAGDRARPGREVRADRGHVRRRQPPSSATSSR